MMYRGLIGLCCSSVLLAACSGGGGGGGGPSLGVGFSAPSASAAEGDSVVAVLALRSSKGNLTEDLQVTVTVGGTATPGADHDFLADQVVTFPAGSAHGDTLDLTVNLVDDGLVEGGDETLVMTLATPTQGQLGGKFGSKVHTLTLEETDFADLGFVVASSATPAEGATHPVEVELSLSPGDALGVDARVTLRDTTTGSATSVVDYQSITNQVLLFPSGSTNGARQSVSVVSLDDIDVEGDETLYLSLSDPSSGALLSGVTHELTITDDDVAGTAFLVTSGALSGGPTVTLSDGDSLDLGSQQLNSGPNGALAITVHNSGAQSIQVDPLRLTGNVADFSIALDPGTYALPVGTAGPFPYTATSDDLREGVTLEFDPERHAVLEGADFALLSEVPLPGGGELVLQLERVELPFAPGAQVRVGDVLMPLEQMLEDLSLWEGSALGYEGSEAFLSFSGTNPGGWIRLGDGSGTVHLTTEHSSGQPTVRMLWETQVMASYQAPPTAPCLGARTLPGVVSPSSSASPQTAEMNVGLTISNCTLAIETDYQLYDKLGSTGAVTQYVTQLIAAVSLVYERDVQTRLSIAYLGIHDDPNDGWTTQETPGSNAGDLLDEFRAAWLNNIPAGANLAHFISGASLGGGVAYLGVICSPSFGFGVSGSINGNINWGSFNGSPSFANWDFVVVAHELGHNFGANHTHEYCPPLDDCYASGCAAGASCSQGTLMSYCHLCGGMNNIDLDFHPFVAQAMRAEVGSSCLATAVLAPGASTSVTVSFQPTSGLGAKAAQLELIHTAPNEPSPFSLNLSGTGTN